MTMTSAERLELDALKAEVADLRAEMGPKDLTATPWHQRQVELINAFGEMAGRLDDIPGGKLASDVIVARAKAEIGTGGGVSSSGDPLASLAALGITIPSAGEFLLRANLAKKPTQGGITDSYAGRFYINGWDAGLRALQNWQHEGTKLLPVGTFGMDSRAAFSYNWWPAELGGQSDHPDNSSFAINSDPNHPLFAAYRGQTLIIDGGSQTPRDYADGAILSDKRHVLIASQRPAWPIYFAVSPTRPGGYPANKAVIKLNSDGSPNPVEIVLNGKLRRLETYDLPDGRKGLCYAP